MTNYEAIYEGAKFVITAAASKGAKILVDEAVKQFTPEDLDAKKRFCVEVAKWGGATAFGAVCVKSIEGKLEKGKACIEKVNEVVKAINDSAKNNDAEPVIKDVEENKIVEIEDPEIVEEEPEEDSQN